VIDLSHELADLSPEERALLMQMLQEQGGAANMFPLSFAQQRLWFLDQLEPDSPRYNMPIVIELSGPLDVRALEQSVNTVVRRHEALRTGFVVVDGTPQQLVHAAAPVVLPQHDLSPLPAAEQTTRLHAQIQAAARQPFDLRQPPLLRATLLRLAPERHVLLVTLHHIVADGWSYGLLIQELAHSYTAYAQGHTPALPELPIQYADYALWQRDWVASTVREQQQAYWQQQLAGVTRLDLPTDRPRPARGTLQGAQHTGTLEPALAAALKALSQQLGVTPYMLLLAGFQLVLQRYSGQSDIAVGTPVANRTRPEVEGLIGFFVNTLVLRTDLGGTPTVREMLERVRTVVLGALARQDLPFEEVVALVQPTREVLGETPLVQVMFAMQTQPLPTIDLGALTIRPLKFPTEVTKFDLTLDITELNDSFEVVFEYSTDLFDATTIARWLEHYRMLLHAMVADPDRRLAELPRLPEAERRLLVETWNATAMPYPDTACIHHLVEEQVARTPDAIAATFEQQNLSYAELNRRANQLAHHLQVLGVGPETRVGICVERSLEMLIGLLGILKAGGAYVPLDPDYPAERLRLMLDDAQTQVLLTQQDLLARLPRYAGALVCLDTDWPTIASAPATNPRSAVHPDNLAYLIYTSGSTGRPKGAMLSHRGVCNNLWWRKTHFTLGSGDAVLQAYSFSFDPSVWAFFWPLVTGARVVMIRSGEHYDTAVLARAIMEHNITVYGAAPALHAALLEERGIAGCSSLRYIVSGGDSLYRDLQHKITTQLHAELYNAYGPTEATIDVTSYRCSTNEAQLLTPIGRPLPNVQLYVLDRALQLVPIGAVGELYIGGVGLARGYHQRPELTAERFLPDPFGSSAGARIYKTGDLVRYRADGQLEFWGRTDQQVKIRGFRIELGEIESVLREHPAIQDAVAIVREDLPAAAQQPDKQLVAYLVPKAELHQQPESETAMLLSNSGSQLSQTSVQHLRAFLQRYLPAPMIPSAFVLVDALPLSPSGKLDLAALPLPEAVSPDQERSFVAEAQIAEIWRALLKIEQLGRDDNFFELGGHSLLATQMMSRLRDRFGVELPLSAMFEMPTVAALAQRIDTLRPAATQAAELGRDSAQLDDDELAGLLAQLESLSDDEAEALLAQRSGQPGR
jgi:amino acid adenylation domain-containing protein